jgi:putative membrane protein
MNLKRIAYSFSICAATALFACTVAVAQMTQPPSIPQPQQQPTMPNAQNPGPGAHPGTGQDFGDKAFVSKAMEGNDSEVQLGQLAEQKSQSADVKQFAQKMVSDHSQMNDKWFTPVAQQLGVTEPKGPSKKDKKEIARLEQLSGPDFDRQYITLMVKDHQQDLKAFQNEAKVAQDPNVKQVAQEGSNVIAQHLQMIEQVAKNHSIDTGETAKSPSM